MAKTLRVKILTVSDSAAEGRREDLSGRAVRQIVEKQGWEVQASEVAPDEIEAVQRHLRAWLKKADVDLILTTGGTGLGPRDITPEATRPLLEREIPGLGEMMRAEGSKKTKRAVLSRSLAGVCWQTMILNLPGSPQGAQESLECILDLIPHIVDLIKGKTRHEGKNPEV